MGVAAQRLPFAKGGAKSGQSKALAASPDLPDVTLPPPLSDDDIFAWATPTSKRVEDVSTANHGAPWRRRLRSLVIFTAL